MNAIASHNMTGGTLVLLSLVTGIILSSIGKPLNDAVFTAHKLIAVGTVIVLGIGIYKLHMAGGIQAFHILVFAVTGLFFLALIVSGALLSLVYGSLLTLDEPVLQAVLRIHQIVPILVLVASAISFYLLAKSAA